MKTLNVQTTLYPSGMQSKSLPPLPQELFLKGKGSFSLPAVTQLHLRLDVLPHRFARLLIFSPLTAIHSEGQWKTYAIHYEKLFSALTTKAISVLFLYMIYDIMDTLKWVRMYYKEGSFP